MCGFGGGDAWQRVKNWEEWWGKEGTKGRGGSVTEGGDESMEGSID